MKIAMLRVPPALKAVRSDARLLLQVHDELVLEVPEAQRDLTVRAVREVMENAYTLSIPLVTEARWGENWGNLEVLPA